MNARPVRLRRAEVIGHGIVDVLIDGGVVLAIGATDAVGVAGELVIECGGMALLPGIQDHHCHLMAAAAALTSVPCGPPCDASALGRLLRGATPDASGWVRGIGYDEQVAGDLDATRLDALTGPAPTRVQHRSGALWMLNSAGVAALGLDEHDLALEGIERDAAGRATGRLWRLDGWLRARLGPGPVPDLVGLSREMASRGIVGVTDATPDLDDATIGELTSGKVRQRLTLLGAAHAGDGYTLGAWKIVIADHALPTWDELAAKIRAVRPRPVALHCVTRASLVLALSVLDDLGVVEGDRLEHAAVVPAETTEWLARLGLAVITQPSLVALRGGDYLDRVDDDDRDCLWPAGSLMAAGIPLAMSSDAPYGSHDPWFSVASAVERTCSDGRAVNPNEGVTAWQALRSYLTPPERPGGPERVVAIGAAADLMLLDRRLADALAAPTSVAVRKTLVGGSLIYDEEPER